LEFLLRQLCLWHPPDLVCFEIVPALILIRDFETLHWLYDLYYEDLYDKNDWPSSQITNVFLIGEAFLYLSEGNRKRAQVVHDLIELKRTSLAYVNYVRLFHGLLSLELCAAGGAPVEAAIEQIAAGVEATGFTRFWDLARQRAASGLELRAGCPLLTKDGRGLAGTRLRVDLGRV